jgi:hypothetical protein
MSDLPVGRGGRTSYLDRTWLNHWTVLALTPIVVPDIDEVHAKYVGFMESDPTHPLCCTLEDGGTRWRPVPAAQRRAHVERIIVRGASCDREDPFTYLVDNQPPDGYNAPFKVVIGGDSITSYFAHATGDAAVFSPFSVLMSLGDIEGLKPLRANAGLGVAGKIFLKEVSTHWREWLAHGRSAEVVTSTPTVAVDPHAQPTGTTTAVGITLSHEEFGRFKAWRKVNCPDLSSTALMASATYRALAGQGLSINPAGFYTLIDLRRHLPKNQSLRPGNLAKSAFIPADMDSPADVSTGLKRLVDTSRGVPALLAGAVSAALRRDSHVEAVSGTGPVTMTFNSLVRNPGVEHIPWSDPGEARYFTMSYPSGADGVSIAAAAVEGQVIFSASFDPGILDEGRVLTALEQLRDMPSVLSPGFVELAVPLQEDVSASALHAYASRNGDAH